MDVGKLYFGLAPSEMIIDTALGQKPTGSFLDGMADSCRTAHDPLRSFTLSAVNVRFEPVQTRCLGHGP